MTAVRPAKSLMKLTVWSMPVPSLDHTR